jgi:hypothetical protein
MELKPYRQLCGDRFTTMLDDAGQNNWVVILGDKQLCNAMWVLLGHRGNKMKVPSR